MTDILWRLLASSLMMALGATVLIGGITALRDAALPGTTRLVAVVSAVCGTLMCGYLIYWVVVG